ncbi:MAG TPA: hypothetical protein VFI10_02615 [Gaiellaceae bacterium]|jgi:rubrerythrin|nr:hypothetical protein [Gaiellaceae bacterium]
MPEGSPIETLESAGYVEFFASGQTAAGDFHCAECGYGVSVKQRLPLCPMCGGTAWEQSPWRRRRLL